MRALIACEYSGVLRREMRRLGWDAWSCDLLPAEDGGEHLQCDVMTVIDQGWDFMACFPDCTYLTGSAEWAYKDGPYHQKVRPETLTGSARREARLEAIAFAEKLFFSEIKMVALENPVGVLSTKSRLGPFSQFVHPYEFGDDASKKTCLWLKNLPLLKKNPAGRVPGRWVEWPKASGKFVERWSNQTDSGQNNLTPGEDRWKERARTYPGIAKAMATQWSEFVSYLLLS